MATGTFIKASFKFPQFEGDDNEKYLSIFKITCIGSVPISYSEIA